MSDVETLLRDRGALLQGHFQLASGRHADTYIEKFRILQWPDLTSQMCATLANRFQGQATVVAGPTTGGVILAYETARQMGLHCIIAERREDGPGREFRRGFTVGEGDRVLIVDDVLTTGGSIREVMDAVVECGAEVAGVGVLVDRTGGAVDLGVPFEACMTIQVASWSPDECTLCVRQVPLKIT